MRNSALVGAGPARDSSVYQQSADQMTKAALCAAFCILMATQSLASDAHSSDLRISTAGYGDLRIGMSKQQLEKILHNKVGYESLDGPSCEYASSPSMPDGMAVMLHDGRVVRIDAGVKTKTVSGLGVGSSKAEVLKALGDGVVVSHHHYGWPPGEYLTFYTKNKRRGMRFETDGKFVTSFYVGETHAIQLVEGCA